MSTLFTIYQAIVRGEKFNNLYPNECPIEDEFDLECATTKDYVCAKYKNGHRANADFISSDCLPMDCDNDRYGDDPHNWITPQDVADNFPGVTFAVQYSKSNNIDKYDQETGEFVASARPRFHVLFPIDEVDNAAEYKQIKENVNALFPFFDTNALDAGRFLFGTADPEVEIFNGDINLSQFLRQEMELDAFLDSGGDLEDFVIPEGKRNKTISHMAGKILIRLGDVPEAYDQYLRLVNQCEGELSKQEVEATWRSALRFYGMVSSQPGYIPPEIYNDPTDYSPADFTHADEAAVLANYFINELRYSPATQFLRYKDGYWQETKTGARTVVHELTERQVRDATRQLREAKKNLAQYHEGETLVNCKRLGVVNPEDFPPEVAKAFKQFKRASEYLKFAINYRNTKNITGTLTEVAPLVEVRPDELNADPYLLNTPAGTYDLRRGTAGLRDHSPTDLLTKITAVSPSEEGMDMWLKALEDTFCGDHELIAYVKKVCGLILIGRVYLEAIIIAYGSGRNGKSTFWETISNVLGSYSGKVSASTLTYRSYGNVKNELADAFGKRFLVASEMQSGARLNDSMIKQLCSTDAIYAEKKYKDPFTFIPSHTLVLYTNHLPRCSESDNGTLRRLIIIPFEAVFPEDSDHTEDFKERLFERAGGACLWWMIEGAEEVICDRFLLEQPRCVREAIEEYVRENDWLSQFIEDKCVLGDAERVPCQEFYCAYREYAQDMGLAVRRTADFYKALEDAGFRRVVDRRLKYVVGVRLKTASEEGELDDLEYDELD